MATTASNRRCDMHRSKVIPDPHSLVTTYRETSSVRMTALLLGLTRPTTAARLRELGVPILPRADATAASKALIAGREVLRCRESTTTWWGTTTSITRHVYAAVQPCAWPLCCEQVSDGQPAALCGEHSSVTSPDGRCAWPKCQSVEVGAFCYWHTKLADGRTS